MTSEIKRVDQLEVGDVVIFPYCKGPSTIDLIKKIDGELLRYGISTEEVNSLGIYFGDVEVTYLGKKGTKKVILSSLDKSHLSSIGKEVYRLRKERAEFLKRKGYKVMKGLYLEQDYWVHESVLDRWDYSSYVMDTNHSKYPNDSVLEY